MPLPCTPFPTAQLIANGAAREKVLNCLALVKTEAMIEEYEQKRQRQVSRMRSIMDYMMGFVFFLIGVYFLIYEKFGWNVFNRKPSPLDYFIGILFILYGGWRIYRGYKKDYFK